MYPSGSRAGLLLACQYWARSDVEGPTEDGNDWSEYGTCVHWLAEDLFNNHEFSSPIEGEWHPSNVLSHDKFEQAKVDAWALYQWQATKLTGEKFVEQKVVYNCTTNAARVLTSKTPRDYSEATPEEFPGTADLIVVRPNGVATVVDYKTGNTPAKVYKGQLNFLARCASLIWNCHTVHCVILKVRDGQCYPEHWVMTHQDLTDFGNELSQAFVSAPSSEPQPGEHCFSFYCPLRGTCPASLEKIKDVVDTSQINSKAEVRDNEHANVLYQISKVLTETKKVITLSLKRYSDKVGGIPLSNGKVFSSNGKSYAERSQ